MEQPSHSAFQVLVRMMATALLEALQSLVFSATSNFWTGAHSSVCPFDQFVSAGND